MINIKKELVIFLILFVVSSIAVHISSWQTNPIEHIKLLFSHPMPYHPFLYTFLIYIVVAILRFFVNLLKKLFNKS